MSKSLVLILVIVAVAAVVFGGYWFLLKDRQAPPEEETSSLGSQLFEQTTQNPVEGQVPDTNPFKDHKNPLDTIYQNPFK